MSSDPPVDWSFPAARHPIEAPPSRLADAARRELEEALGPDRVSTEEADRLAYSRDCWPLLLIEQAAGRVRHVPDAVCWPGSSTEVATAVDIARRHGVPLVPFGGGSGVCGAAVAKRGGIVCDVKRLDEIVEIDEVSHLAEAETGINGWHLEKGLRSRGFTLGHFPSSIMCSTLGGWIAARSSGQLSTKYGSIEDMVRGLEVVLPSGELARVRAQPRRAAGPDLVSPFIGSEGILGVVTRAALRIHPLPEGRIFRAFTCPDFTTGLEAIRTLLQAGVRPAAVRLYDALDTLIGAPKEETRGDPGLAGRLKAWLPDLLDRVRPILLRHPGVANALADLGPESCLLVLVFEGSWPRIKLDDERTGELLGAIEGLEDAGAGPARAWWEGRYDVSFKQSRVYMEGAFVDTMEVSARWRDLAGVYEAVRMALRSEAIVLAHVSHAYTDGANIYFTFSAALPDSDDPSERTAAYRRIWRAGLRACQRAGGSISHHHGIGLQKAAFLEEEWGGLLPLLRGMKESLDPDDILNPGGFGLDGSPPGGEEPG